MTHPASTSNIKISNINLFMWHFASVIMHFLKNKSVFKLSLAHKVSLYIFTFTLTEILFMTGANKGGGNGQRFQNKSLVYGGLFKEGITTRSGAISYTFLLSFFNKYKLLGHYNASTALDVCKLHLYKAMCVCSTKSYVAVVQERKKNGSRGCRGKSYGCPRVNVWIIFFPLDSLPFKKNLKKKKTHRASRLIREQSHGTSLFRCA